MNGNARVTTRAMAALSMLIVAVGALAQGAAAQGGPVEMGTAVPYVDSAGVEHGSVTVTEIQDPFTDYLEGYAPDPGTKFVLARVSFEGTGEGDIEASLYDFLVHDADGGIWERATVYVPDDFPTPELSSTTVGPGSRVSGFVSFIVPEDATVDQVLYQADQGVLLIPADLGSARPAVGSPVTVNGAEGASVATTVKEVTDPFKGFDKQSAPGEGARYVMVTAAFDNSGDVPFRLDPFSVVLRDARGALWGPTPITPAKKIKVPVLDNTNLAPGDLVTGRLGFAVPADVPLDGVYWSGQGHLTLLADLAGAGAATGSGEEPAVAALPSCDELQAWVDQVSPLTEQLDAITGTLPSESEGTQGMLTDLSGIAILLDMVPAESPALEIPHRQLLATVMLHSLAAERLLAFQEATEGEREAFSDIVEAFNVALAVQTGMVATLDALGLDDCEGA